MIPRKRNSLKGNADMDWGLYSYRHLVENTFARLKQYRAVATRYDKLKRNYESMVAIMPDEAMQMFRDWVINVTGANGTPIFVGFNAAFDWSFINYYFHRYLGENPFGFTALDIKSMYMGFARCSWEQTKSSHIAANLHPKLTNTHDALQDACYQAELFRLIRSGHF